MYFQKATRLHRVSTPQPHEHPFADSNTIILGRPTRLCSITNHQRFSGYYFPTVSSLESRGPRLFGKFPRYNGDTHVKGAAQTLPGVTRYKWSP